MIEYKGFKFSESAVYNMMNDGYGYYEALETLYRLEQKRECEEAWEYIESISTCA